MRLRKRRPELRRARYVGEGEVQWHGTEPGAPNWGDDSRLVALSQRGPDGGGLYCAWSASHLPVVLGLPEWGGREWRPLLDSGKPAPCDVLEADGALGEGAMVAALVQAAAWTREGQYPLLPWSCVVLESVPVGTLPQDPAVAAVESVGGAGASRTGGGGAAGGRQAGPAPTTPGAATGPTTPTTTATRPSSPPRARTEGDERVLLARVAAENEELRRRLEGLQQQ